MLFTKIQLPRGCEHWGQNCLTAGWYCCPSLWSLCSMWLHGTC